jgi:hypothetical protein
MKKRNLLRASGIMVVLAVLGFLSACDNFIPYEDFKEGHLILSKNTISEDDPLSVTVAISSKIKDRPSLSLEWDPVTGVHVTQICEFGGTPTPETSPVEVTETTTYIFKTTISGGTLIIIVKNEGGDVVEKRDVTID